MIGRQQHIEIAVAIEVSISQSAADFGLGEVRARFESRIPKTPVAVIQEELRRLSIPYISMNVANGIVDVAVGENKVQRPIEIEVGKDAAESEHRTCRSADSRLDCDIFIAS